MKFIIENNVINENAKKMKWNTTTKKLHNYSVMQKIAICIFSFSS